MSYNAIISTLIRSGAKRVTKYITPGFVIKATRVGKIDGRFAQKDVRLTIGRPNYLERERIREAVRAGEPFPIRRLQIKHARKKKA